MVVVAVDLRRSVSMTFGLAAVEGEAAEGSILVEDEKLAVARPVGGFKVRGGDVVDVAIGGGDGDGFKRADEDGFAG